MASKKPLPTKYFNGLYPNIAKCPGALPGVTPGKTGFATPHEEIFESWSRLGIFATSNSDFPVF